ncbi:C-C chemokine receptor type 5-like [Xenia sp. Carnegie-2017]|uniref:C-C chemokine receptor type 5-like n=1 Tax=Xenia sp. Carnegie-2017 TaxID=2897299 RepID=UPI001F04723F|nr:C-C chemokine receptor type 5-like [Xenia sp. Carnegie-2017]
MARLCVRKCLTVLDTTLRKSIADDKQRLKILKSKQKTVKIVFVVMMAFFCLWAPNHIMYLLFQFGGIHNLKWNSTYYQAGIVLGFCSSWLNPFLYAFQSRDFRTHAYKVLRKIFCEQSSSRPFEDSHGTISSLSSGQTKNGFRKLKSPVV